MKFATLKLPKWQCCVELFTTWQWIDANGVRGTLVTQNSDKARDALCPFDAPPRKHIRTSPSSSNHNVTPIVVTARLVIGQAQPAELRQSLLLLNTDESP
jgi:hypothetical protein